MNKQHRANPLHKAFTLKKNPENELKEAFINAAIMAGLAFFSTLAGTGVAGLMVEPVKAFIAAGVAAGVAFFTGLAIERGIKIE